MRDDPGAGALLKRVFARPVRRAADGLTLWVSGTNFQIQVWRALLRLPFAGMPQLQPAGCTPGQAACGQVCGQCGRTQPGRLSDPVSPRAANPASSAAITGAMGARWRSLRLGGSKYRSGRHGTTPPLAAGTPKARASRQRYR